MSGSDEQNKEIRFLDKRTVDRYVRSGQVDEKGLEKHLKGLPDLAENMVSVDTTMSDEDFDDDDDDDDTDDDDTDDDEAPAE